MPASATLTFTDGFTVPLLDPAIEKPITSFHQQVISFILLWLEGKDIFSANTSGSTGSPKTISLTKDQIKASVNASIEALGLKKGDTALLCLHHEVIASKMLIVRAIEAEMNLLVSPPSSNPLKGLNHKIDFISLVPNQLYTIWHSEESVQLKNIRTILIGGGTIDADFEKNLSLPGCKVFHSYGMTETASHIALRRIDISEQAYTVLPNVSISLTSDSRLEIKGPQTNYEKLVTNDLAEIVAPGKFIILGRADQAIISGGIKIHPSKVEAVLSMWIPIGRRFFVTGMKDERYGEKLVLVIEGQHDENLLQILKNNIPAHLAKYEHPKAIYFFNNFAETLSGKINKKAVIEALCGRIRK